MKKLYLNVLIVLGLCLVVGQMSFARGREVTQIADQYLANLDRQVDNYCIQLDRRADRCAELISRLIYSGEEAAAIEFADDAIGMIEQLSQRRIEQITRQAKNIANLLKRFGEDRLANDIINASQQAVLVIQEQTDLAIYMIIDLFYNGAEEPAE